MRQTNQTMIVAMTTYPQSVSSETASSEINVPVVPQTAPSVAGSDLFYIIIALTMFTKVTVEAIALLVKVIVRGKVTEKE